MAPQSASGDPSATVARGALPRPVADETRRARQRIARRRSFPSVLLPFFLSPTPLCPLPLSPLPRESFGFEQMPRVPAMSCVAPSTVDYCVRVKSDDRRRVSVLHG